jgi:hypothetical protein
MQRIDMFKKIFIFTAIAGICIGCSSDGGGSGGASETTYKCGSGNGSQTSPYMICTEIELEVVRDNMNWYYQLADDINFTGTWSPIGTRAIPFKGSFNGNGYTIYNLTVTGEDYLGLFGYIANGKVSNLKLESILVTGNNYVGGIVGRINSGVITNSSVVGTITAKNEVGGIAGYVSDSEIEKVSSSGNITASGVAGGIAGSAINSAIANSYSEMNMSSKNYFGGLVGSLRGGSLSFCHAIGSIASTDSAGTNMGGLIGYAENAAIDANFALNSRISAQRNVNRVAGNSVNCTALNNYALNMPLWGTSDGGIRGETISVIEAENMDTYINAGWDFRGSIWEFPSTSRYPVLY